jgi:hypothetical protein
LWVRIHSFLFWTKTALSIALLAGVVLLCSSCLCFLNRYSVETFSQEEEELYGEFGIKLVHPNETKRVWLFRADSEKEHNEWIQTFMNACNKSMTDPNKDMLLVNAFRRALKATRAAYGYFGVCDIIGSEEEMLTQFIKQVLGREVLEEFFVANARRKSVDVLHLKTKVNQLIYPAACVTWKREFTNLQSVKEVYREALRASLNSVIVVEESIQREYGVRINTILEPILRELGETICNPILEISLEGILISFENAVVCFCQLLMNESDFFHTEQSANKALEKLKDEVDTLDGFLAPSFTELWNCYTQDLVHMDIMLEKSGSSSYTVYANVLEDIRQLIHNAIHTLQQLICEEDQFKDFPSSPSDSLTHEQIMLQYEVMLQRLENDAAKTIEERLISTILIAMEAPLQEMVLGPVQDMMSTAKKVPREVRAMINLNCVGERIVREAVNAHVRTLLHPAMDKIYPQILQWREQIRSQKYRSISRAATGSSDLQKLSAELRNMKY